jgi:hypothetical protein
MCGRLRVGKGNLHVALLAGAAMCSACWCRGDEEYDPDNESLTLESSRRTPWNKGELIGASLAPVLINAQIAALLVAEFVQKTACLSKKTAIDPRPFSRCDFRLGQARFHSEERPMEGEETL